MCGIVAIFAHRDNAPAPERSELLRIRDSMHARGPDDSGCWQSDDGRIMLAHRRLSIIDLSSQATQPMTSANGRYTIIFNGEIYNFRELRSWLQSRGYRLATNSDTEVLLHLYADQGLAMFARLRGMFALALYDSVQHQLILARDPFGIKPLYYADDGKTLRVASQVKALLAGDGINLSPEPAGIVGFYLFGSVPEPWTMFKQIQAVPAGSYILVDADGLRKAQSFFSLAERWQRAEKSCIAPEAAQQRVRQALLSSVEQHLVADVPVGAFLSSGIDSSVLVALMTELAIRDGRDPAEIQTLTLAFSEFSGQAEDESVLAEKTAGQYGTSHTTRLVQRDEFIQDLPAIMEAMDQPTIDGINTWFAAKAAKEQGVKVVLSGLGGDELFGGYPSFKYIPRWVRRLHLFSCLPLAGLLQRQLFSFFSPCFGGISPKAGGLLEYGGSYAGAWFLKRGLFMPWELDELLDRDTIQTGLAKLNHMAMIQKKLIPEIPSSFGRIATLEGSLYMRNQLLRDTDWASMAHSVEVRVPLVDPCLLAAVAPIMLTCPESGKNLLAHSPKHGLPPAVLERKKTGFITPVQSWQKKSLSAAGPGMQQHWSRRWALHVGHAFFQERQGIAR